MRLVAATLLLSSLCVMAEAPKRSGHATAQWLAPAKAIKAGEDLQTVIRLVVDDPWHVYWYNPGEAGMETSIEIKLPEGWTSSGLLHPVPKAFKTGGLHGFGHEGTVDYALTLTAPKDFDGRAQLEGNVLWLSCNDDACIPGEMMLKLNMVEGKPAGAAVDDEAIAAAYAKLPLRNPMGMGFSFTDGGKQWNLRLSGNLGLDPAKASVFVATPELVPASAKLTFKKEGQECVATAPKGEFAPKKPDAFAILLYEKGKRPVHIEWKQP